MIRCCGMGGVGVELVEQDMPFQKFAALVHNEILFSDIDQV